MGGKALITTGDSSRLAAAKLAKIARRNPGLRGSSECDLRHSPLCQEVIIQMLSNSHSGIPTRGETSVMDTLTRVTFLFSEQGIDCG